MSLKDSISEITGALIHDEKIIKNAFKLEQLFKKYKLFIYTSIALIIGSLIYFNANSYFKERQALKYSAVYNNILNLQGDNNNNILLSKVVDVDKLKVLEKELSTSKIYDLYLLSKATQDLNLEILQNLSKSKNHVVSLLSQYQLASIDREVESLSQVNKYVISDLAKLEQAYILFNEMKKEEAIALIDSIDIDSSIIEMARIIKHYGSNL